MALPIVYSLVQSIKPMEEIFAYPPKFFVKNPTFDNYIQVYQLCQNLWVPLSRYVFNSLFKMCIRDRPSTTGAETA